MGVSDESEFSEGDVVDVRGHGRATVISFDSNPSSPFYQKYKVRYHEDDTTYHCRSKTLRKLYPSLKRVLVSGWTERYRDSLIHNVERQDVCLEIGCHVGRTTLMLHNRCNFAVGIDTSPIVVENARQMHPHVRFEHMDGHDLDAVCGLSPNQEFTKVFIDISGKAELPLVTKLIELYLARLPHCMLIVKNEALYFELDKFEKGLAPKESVATNISFLERCEVFRHWFKGAKTRMRNIGTAGSDSSQVTDSTDTE